MKKLVGCQWPGNVRELENFIERAVIVTRGSVLNVAAGIASSDFRKEVESQTPLGRIGQPQDIAPAAVFLASADSAWMTGETLYISGGLR